MKGRIGIALGGLLLAAPALAQDEVPGSYRVGAQYALDMTLVGCDQTRPRDAWKAHCTLQKDGQVYSVDSLQRSAASLVTEPAGVEVTVLSDFEFFDGFHHLSIDGYTVKDTPENAQVIATAKAQAAAAASDEAQRTAALARLQGRWQRQDGAGFFDLGQNGLEYDLGGLGRIWARVFYNDAGCGFDVSATAALWVSFPESDAGAICWEIDRFDGDDLTLRGRDGATVDFKRVRR